MTIASDVSEPAAIAELHERAIKDHPDRNVLVNNAGVLRKINLQDRDTDLQDITREIDINLCGPIRMVKQFLPHFKVQPALQ